MRLGRVTQSMMSTQLLRNLNNNLSNMNKYQDQIATGRQINKPSDDPVGLSYAMRYRSDITANEQFEENIDSSLSWLEFTDTLMEQGNNVLQRIREISVQAANGSNPDTAMEAVRAEIMQLSDQLVTIGNSQFNGKYVFNGQLTDQAPYSKMITQQKLSIAVAGTVNVSTADVTANNNELKLKLDLGKELTVSIPPKDYSGAGGAAAFASDLQTAINEAASAEYAGAVTVAVTPDGSLNIRSTNNSSTGGVEITGGSLAREWLSTSKNLSDLVHTPNPAANVSLYRVEAQYSATDDKDINFEIATGIKMPVNITGNKVFGSPGADDNLFAVIGQIMNALDQQDSKEVSDLLGKLDSRMNSFLETRAELGAKLNRVELSQSRLTDIDLNLRELQSKTEDADIAQLITTLKSYENVYQASLSVGAKVISPSLVDFLR